MSQTNEKRDSLVFSRSDLWMSMKMTWHSACLLLLFLEPMVRKHTCMQTTSVAVMVIFLESGILKVTWSQLCSKYLLSNTKRIDNYILKGTLQFYILRTWINMRAKSFIKNSARVTEARIDEDAWKKMSCAKIRVCTWKNIAPK